MSELSVSFYMKSGYIFLIVGMCCAAFVAYLLVLARYEKREGEEDEGVGTAEHGSVYGGLDSNVYDTPIRPSPSLDGSSSTGYNVYYGDGDGTSSPPVAEVGSSGGRGRSSPEGLVAAEDEEAAC